MLQIEIQNIHKSFRKKQVLNGVSLTAEGGACIGILGGNGSGKSTLLSILAGIQPCDEGAFLCNGKDLLRDTSMREKTVGYVPQGTPLIEELTALDNLSLWYSREAMDRELERGVLRMLGVHEFLKTTVSKMSGGMKKRLSIGCAVAKRPPVLLLDEPTAALDLDCKEKIARYLTLYKQGGGLLLLATHDASELSLCDAWYILKDGVPIPYEYDGDVSRLVKNL